MLRTAGRQYTTKEEFPMSFKFINNRIMTTKAPEGAVVLGVVPQPGVPGLPVLHQEPERLVQVVRDVAAGVFHHLLRQLLKSSPHVSRPQKRGAAWTLEGSRSAIA